jgi:hypothetical protein
LEADSSSLTKDQQGSREFHSREIFLVGDPCRLDQILAHDEGRVGAVRRGTSLEPPVDPHVLGLGFFSCRREDPSRREGVQFDVAPAHLRNPLLEEILHGRFSPLTQGVVLYGGPDSAELPASARSAQQGLHVLQQWALVGIHPLADLRSGCVPLSPLMRRLSAAESIRSGVDLLFSSILEALQGLRVDKLVVPLDSAVTVDFFFSLFGRFPFGISLSERGRENGAQLTALEREICSFRIAEEALRWFADHDRVGAVYFFCQSPRLLQALYSICRDIKMMSPQTEAVFRV